MNLVKGIGDCFAGTFSDPELELQPGDGCSVTGQLRCQQGHSAFHKVSKPEKFQSKHCAWETFPQN